MKREYIIPGIIMLLFVFTVGMSLAYGEDTPHAGHPQDIPLHERFYSTWQIPNMGDPRTASCCNKQDCYPTAIKMLDGKYVFLHRESQQWIPIPDGKLEQLLTDEQESPDGQSHVCATPGYVGNDGKWQNIAVYCATQGSGQ